MVIQRIQSVWLLLAALCIGIFSFTSYVDFTTAYGEFALSAMSVAKTVASEGAASLPDAVYSWTYFALGVLIAVFILVVIFLYGNVKRQRKYTYMALMLVVCYGASVGIYSSVVLNYWGMVAYSIKWAAALPVVGVVSLILAVRGMSKDIRTLASYDRIR